MKKKLKSLCAVVGAAAILSTPALAKETKYDADVDTTPKLEQKFEVPEFSLEGAKVKKKYQLMTSFGPYEIEDPSEFPDSPIMELTLYGVDRNQDGEKDLVYMEVKVPKKEQLDPFTGETKIQEGYTISQLVIDEDYNGYVERILTDAYDAEGNLGMDGIYDEEQISMTIKDVFCGKCKGHGEDGQHKCPHKH